MYFPVLFLSLLDFVIKLLWCTVIPSVFSEFYGTDFNFFFLILTLKMCMNCSDLHNLNYLKLTVSQEKLFLLGRNTILYFADYV